MFLDHYAAITLNAFQMNTENREQIVYYQILIILLRLIGRLAFPIFGFLIVNGYKHTRNPYKYCFRLLVFALISEPFFDYAFSNQLINMNQQNIFFTLALGLVTIAGLDVIKKKYSMMMATFWVVMMGYLSEFLNFDYGFYGIVMIAIMCVYFKNYKKMGLALLILNVTFIFPSFLILSARMYQKVGSLQNDVMEMNYLNDIMGISQIFSLFAMTIIKRYNGEIGKHINKYLFYIFYPLHLFILTMMSAF